MNNKGMRFLFFTHGIVLQVLLCLWIGTAQAMAMNRFEPWDEQVFIAVGERYGKAAAERLRKVHDLILGNQDRQVLDKLKLVNDFLNEFPWIADSVLWHHDDYWAAPFETITTHGGDCEDIAIAKYWILRRMGVQDEKLGLAYVLSSNNRPHMVLLYMSAQYADSLILDNQHPKVLPLAARRDLISIYLFQNGGTLYLIEDDGNRSRRYKARYEQRKLAKWSRTMEREQMFDLMYAKYNKGRPLIPNN